MGEGMTANCYYVDSDTVSISTCFRCGSKSIIFGVSNWIEARACIEYDVTEQSLCRSLQNFSIAKNERGLWSSNLIWHRYTYSRWSSSIAGNFSHSRCKPFKPNYHSKHHAKVIPLPGVGELYYSGIAGFTNSPGSRDPGIAFPTYSYQSWNVITNNLI